MTTTPIRAEDGATLPCPPADVWAVLADVASYPRWWPPSLHVRVAPDGEVEIRPRGGRPFRCRVASADPPRELRMRYAGGFIEGTGVWRLADAEGGGTRVTYTVDVVAHGRLVAFLARFLDYGRMHSRLMEDVFRHLGEDLDRRAAREPDRSR